MSVRIVFLTEASLCQVFKAVVSLRRMLPNDCSGAGDAAPNSAGMLFWPRTRVVSFVVRPAGAWPLSYNRPFRIRNTTVWPLRGCLCTFPKVLHCSAFGFSSLNGLRLRGGIWSILCVYFKLWDHFQFPFLLTGALWVLASVFFFDGAIRCFLAAA